MDPDMEENKHSQAPEGAAGEGGEKKRRRGHRGGRNHKKHKDAPRTGEERVQGKPDPAPKKAEAAQEKPKNAGEQKNEKKPDRHGDNRKKNSVRLIFASVRS